MLTLTEDAQKIMILFRQDRKTAEKYLLNFNQIYKQYAQQKEAYISYKESDNNIGGGRGGVGNPTEQKALKSIEFDSKSETAKWLKAVTICKAELGERKNIFIACRIAAETRAYRNGEHGRKAWVVYTQQKYAQEIEKRFLTHEYVAEKTIRNWWKDIIDRVVYIANKI